MAFFLRNTLAMRQVRETFLLAVLLGLASSTVLITVDVMTVRTETRETIAQLMLVVEDAATQAAYELDTSLAEQVLQGLFAFQLVQNATITNDFDLVMAQGAKPASSDVAPWLTKAFLGAKVQRTIPLTRQNIEKPVGFLTVSLDTNEAAISFLWRSARTVLWSLAASLVLAALLGYRFHATVTSPLSTLAHQVASVPPDAPGKHLLTVPSGHEKTELGSLVNTSNAMLTRLGKSLHERLEAEAKYRSIFDNAVEGIFQTTADGKIVNANPAMAAILGFPDPKDLLASVSNIGAQCYASDDAHHKLLRMLHEQQQVTGFETMMVQKDGNLIWASISARAVLDATKNVILIEGFMLDITARRQAQEELDILNRQLEGLVDNRTQELLARSQELELANARLLELDKVKSDFLSSVSHELRTPMTSLLGFTRLIKKDFQAGLRTGNDMPEEGSTHAKRIQSNLGIIEAEALRLTRMIDDFLDISRIESGHMAWNEITVNLAALAMRAYESAQGLFVEEQGPAFERIVEQDTPDVRVDADRLHQVLMNLLYNAVKYTKAGKVTLWAGKSRSGAARLEVRDTGKGIPLQERATIFTKFYQVPGRLRTEADAPKGTGLGLAICREIVNHYQGRLWVESEEGKGSTFIVELPAYYGHEASESRPA